jgi:2',3'-cyclic-nucleotide 2'-phosphodiesterase (5'-nucleotidase family)
MDSVELLRQELPLILAAEPDLIVLATHQGAVRNAGRDVNEVLRIVDEFPQIDLVLGGHTHRPVAGERLGPGTWYVQAGAHGEWVAVVVVTVDVDDGTVVDLDSSLIPVTPSTPRHAGLEAALEPWISQELEVSSRVICDLNEPVRSRGTAGESCESSEMLCRAIADAAGVGAVLHGRLTRFSLSSGPLTEADLFRLIPYENDIVTVWVDEGALVELIEEQQGVRHTSAYCGIWGLEVWLDADDRVSRIRTADGDPFPAEGLRVALNSYTAAGAGGRFPRLAAWVRSPGSRALDTGLGTRDVLARYLRRHGTDLHARCWLQR